MTKLSTNNPGNLSSALLPPTYLRLLTSLEDTIAEAGAKKKKLNTTHSKALNGMKQKIKKLQREHESSVNKYKVARLSLCACGTSRRSS